jgi:hypothetical protein
VAISGEFLAISKLKEEIFNWSWRIPLGRHSRVIGGQVLGSDGAVVRPQMLK